MNSHQYCAMGKGEEEKGPKREGWQGPGAKEGDHKVVVTPPLINPGRARLAAEKPSLFLHLLFPSVLGSHHPAREKGAMVRDAGEGRQAEISFLQILALL